MNRVDLRAPLLVVLCSILAAACGGGSNASSPTAPSAASPTAPGSAFTSIEGEWRLTVTYDDDSCPGPPRYPGLGLQGFYRAEVTLTGSTITIATWGGVSGSEDVDTGVLGGSFNAADGSFDVSQTEGCPINCYPWWNMEGTIDPERMTGTHIFGWQVRDDVGCGVSGMLTGSRPQ